MSDAFNLDFTDVQGGDFDALPAGNYLVAVTDWDNTETKNAGTGKNPLPVGTPGINWEFTVQDGEFENRKVWTNHWLHPNALGFLKSFLAASGIYSEEELGGQLDFDPDKVVGAQVVAKVSKREYPKDSGSYVNDIKGFKPSSQYRGAGASSEGSLMP